ncbi:hypothetical protein HDV00_010860 [Rhizophlyctis rosea]|nr:hypothetical protein HDV00_010860 [Rhizophlyctis rosea]
MPTQDQWEELAKAVKDLKTSNDDRWEQLDQNNKEMKASLDLLLVRRGIIPKPSGGNLRSSGSKSRTFGIYFSVSECLKVATICKEESHVLNPTNYSFVEGRSQRETPTPVNIRLHRLSSPTL